MATQQHELIPAGIIKVAPRAIATIVVRAALQTPGVVGLASAGPLDPATHAADVGLAVLGRHEAYRGVEVTLSDSMLVIELFVILAYGSHIVEVARDAEARVRSAVELALGRQPDAIYVRVQGLRRVMRDER